MYKNIKVYKVSFDASHNYLSYEANYCFLVESYREFTLLALINMECSQKGGLSLDVHISRHKRL